MKQFGRLVAKYTGYGLGIAAFLVAFSVQAAPGSAKVQAIRAGGAQFSTDGVAWNDLQVGAVLNAGTTVKTDGMGVVDLYLGKNGPLVRVTPATTLALSTLNLDEGAGETVINTELGLTEGRIQGVVRKLSGASRYEIKTPMGTCGIRGSRYEVTARLRVTMDEGTSEVRYTPAGGTPATFEVKSGFTFDPTLNGYRGGVIPTPSNVADQVREDLNELMGGMTPAEAAQYWLPAPNWGSIPRPFDPPGMEWDKPFVLPPVQEPTTVVKP